jgi:thymidylate kinase
MMIVELFGPPAVGKSTLANALSVALRKDGCAVQLIASSRPAEQGRLSRGRTFAAPLRRFAKLAHAVPLLLAASRTDSTGKRLMDIMPPRGMVRSVRLRRYLAALQQSWVKMSADDSIAIVDQGYLTAICSLALQARSADADQVASSLALVPKPDLLIRLTVPNDILRARLVDRLRRLGRVERLFELDIDTSLRQAEIVQIVTRLLPTLDCLTVDVECGDQCELDSAVAKIIGAIAQQRGTVRQ